jgi:ABC-type uncharacterized transport system YnjBCD ATPase subunit
MRMIAPLEITIRGPIGSGKSTLAVWLKAVLGLCGHTVLVEDIREVTENYHAVPMEPRQITIKTEQTARSAGDTA